MAFAPGAWVRDSVGVYIGNATAVRDYRVQLRGNRAVLLWGAYLIVMIGFCLLTYNGAASRQEMSIVEAQRSLQTFYQSILYMLATLVLLIAPALTATAIVSERQRRSLDLVFSAPVSPKYYLVGKMISSYRYIWMLLVLSLPVTAACVVLGGASWSEVLASYALLSLHGLIFTSIALLFSTVAQKPVGAIVWSYIGVACYTWAASGIALPLAYGGGFGPHRARDEMSFLVTLSPYAIVTIPSSYTIVAGYHVPNWVFAALFTLCLTKLLLLGAASLLSPYGAAETKSLRIHSVIYMAAIAYGSVVAIDAATIGSRVSTMVSSSGAVTSTSAGALSSTVATELLMGRAVAAAAVALMIFIPVVACFGTDLEKKFWPDGVFRLRRMWVGSPSGALPFLLALVLAAAVGMYAYALVNDISVIGVHLFAYLFFSLALVFFAWALGRMTSAMSNGLRAARTLHFTFLVLVMAVPVPFISIADPYGFDSSTLSGWDFYLLRPLASSGDRSVHAAILGTVLTIVGLVLVKWSEGLAKARYARIGVSYDRA